jgi:hypothetical protein
LRKRNRANAPPSELIVPPSKRTTISRLPQASNPKLDWLHSVIAKAVPPLALTAVWKLSYATKNGLLPTICEISGLINYAQAIGADRRKSPPREGPALLQGLVVCGVYGSRMTVRYHTRQDHLVPEYVCQRDGIEHVISICQRIAGDQIDRAVSQLLVESVTPLALEVTLSVQQERKARAEEWISFA